jgi:hypothetical protein
MKPGVGLSLLPDKLRSFRCSRSMVRAAQYTGFRPTALISPGRSLNVALLPQEKDQNWTKNRDG